jgi:hypothetical protein
MDVIICTNCKAQNSVLNPKCKECGSILQHRVANLNLTDTIWQVLERPKEAFQKICLSEQKNYVFLIFAFIGIGLMFTTYWHYGAGDHYNNLLYLLIQGLAFGPFVGVIVFYVYSYLSFLITKHIFKTETNIRNLRATIAYSLIPALFATIFILPTELIVFGLYFFTSNPSPLIYKPEAYYVLVSLDILSLIYSIFLFYIGIKVSNNIGKAKSFLITVILLIVFACLVFLPMEILRGILK